MIRLRAVDCLLLFRFISFNTYYLGPTPLSPEKDKVPNPALACLENRPSGVFIFVHGPAFVM
jgi:hypothetical protein